MSNVALPKIHQSPPPETFLQTVILDHSDESWHFIKNRPIHERMLPNDQVKTTYSFGVNPI